MVFIDEVGGKLFSMRDLTEKQAELETLASAGPVFFMESGTILIFICQIKDEFTLQAELKF